jgi:RND family efflux transporter MFP subunit
MAIGLWAASGLLMLASGCNGPSEAAAPNTESSNASAPLDRVQVGHVTRVPFELVTSQPGRVMAFEETPLFAKVTGYVQHVLVDIGDVVQKDQTLIELWIPEFDDQKLTREAEVLQAAAVVTQAESAIQGAKAQVASAEAKIRQAEAGVARAVAEENRWKSEYERIRELGEKGSVTTKLVDETLNQLRAAEAARLEVAANVETVQAELKVAQARVAQAQADLKAAQASQAVAEANLRQSETMIGYTKIKAPFDGVITARSVDTGHYVHPASGGSDQPLMVVARSDQVRIFVDVPEMEAPLVDIGDSATIRVQSLQNREFTAQVRRTSWALDTTNRSLRTEINMKNDEGLLRSGMYARVSIVLEYRDNVPMLPITAIVRDGDSAFCYCVRDEKVVRTPLQLGMRSGNSVEILSGVDESQLVVLARADGLKDGQQVEVIQPKE